jgi:hypothetical protein
MRTIEIVAALVRDDAGRVLLVRKRGTTAPPVSGQIGIEISIK